MRIPSSQSYLSHQIFQRTKGTHKKDYSQNQVKGEASRETKEGQLKGKKHWLERNDTEDLSSYTVTH